MKLTCLTVSRITSPFPAKLTLNWFITPHIGGALGACQKHALPLSGWIDSLKSPLGLHEREKVNVSPEIRSYKSPNKFYLSV
jgi:hypothetical protein